jgi:hypothetical protein
MKRHPLSAAFPNMPEDDFGALVADIKANGLQQHGWTYEGQILDGWHRYQACEEAGVKFRYEEYRGSDPVAFVKSRNLERRHLTASQKAAAVVACHAWKPLGANQRGSAPGAEAHSAKALAKEAGVGTRTIEQAKAAHQAGLGEAVRDGMLSAKNAAALAAGRDPDAKPKKLDAKDRKIAALAEANASLKEEIEQVRDGAQEAIIQAETAAALLNTDPAKVLARYKGEIERLTKERDEYQTKCGQMVRQIKALERQLAKYEKAAA